MKKIKLLLLILACSLFLGSCKSSKGCGCLSIKGFAIHLVENLKK